MVVGRPVKASLRPRRKTRVLAVPSGSVGGLLEVALDAGFRAAESTPTCRGAMPFARPALSQVSIGVWRGLVSNSVAKDSMTGGVRNGASRPLYRCVQAGSRRFGRNERRLNCASPGPRSWARSAHGVRRFAAAHAIRGESRGRVRTGRVAGVPGIGLGGRNQQEASGSEKPSRLRPWRGTRA